MKTLTHSQFVALLAGISGTVIVGIDAFTDARARKTGNPFGSISKHVRASAFVGANYEKAVQREGNRQGAHDAAFFKTEGLKWGEWLVPNKVITHKGAYYLRTQSTPGQRRAGQAKVLAYRAGNGEFISREQVAPFLPVRADSRKQSAVGIGSASGMTEDSREQVQVSTYAFSSIQKVRINGETYRLVE